jgi:hypothetical protein
VHLHPADSRYLRRLRRALVAAVIVGAALLVPVTPVCTVPLLLAAGLLRHALRSADPAGWSLYREGPGQWWVESGGGRSCAARVELQACLEGSLWLQIERAHGTELPGAFPWHGGGRRSLCIAADALADADWRRLRRRLRLDAAQA